MTIQPWMKPFLKHITNTGGNSVAEMLQDTTPYQVNGPRAIIGACVKSQVAFLQRLHDAGLLTAEDCIYCGE